MELAHVLFMDIVAYSVLFMDEQREVVTKLQTIVRGTQQFKSADACKEVIALPTGDGMALIFFGDPMRAAECALEIASALKGEPKIKLRMGLHTGPVYRVADINTNLNASGGGINIAQRVMDAGGPGQILVSAAMAEVLGQLGRWKPYLTDLGEHPVKHTVKVHFYNLCTEDVGVTGIPSKWTTEAKPQPARRRNWLLAAAIVALLGAAAGVWEWRRTPPPVPTHQVEYSISVQRYKEGQPFGNPFQLAGEMLFEEDYRIAVNLTASDAGYLYLLDDGPLSGGGSSISVLYPGANESAHVSAGTALRYPRATWIKFDRESGTEKLYVIWSLHAPPELEAWKNRTNDMKDGQVVIQDVEQIDAIRGFLSRLLIPSTQILKDEENKRTTLRSGSNLFAHLIRLEHH